MAQKITKTELKNLIKEEVKKLSKVKSLQEQKARIEKQIKMLNENSGGLIDFNNIDWDSDNFPEIKTSEQFIHMLNNVKDFSVYSFSRSRDEDSDAKCVAWINFKDKIVVEDYDGMEIEIHVSHIRTRYEAGERQTYDYPGSDEIFEVTSFMIGDKDTSYYEKLFPQFKKDISSMKDSLAEYLLEQGPGDREPDNDYDPSYDYRNEP